MAFLFLINRFQINDSDVRKTRTWEKRHVFGALAVKLGYLPFIWGE